MAPELMTSAAVIRSDPSQDRSPLPTNPPAGLTGACDVAPLCTMADLDQLVAELDDVDALLASLR